MSEPTDIVFFFVFVPGGNGEVLRSGSCPLGMLEAQAGAGQEVLQYDRIVDSAVEWYDESENTMRVRNYFPLPDRDQVESDGSEVVTWSSMVPALVTKRSPSGVVTQINHAGGNLLLTFNEPGYWYVDLRGFPYLDTTHEIYGKYTLAQAKAAKWDLIKAARDQDINGGIYYETTLFPTDETTRARIGAYAAAAANGSGPTTIFWAHPDGYNTGYGIEIDRDYIIGLNAVMMEHTNGIMQTGAQFRQRIDQCVTIPELDTIQWGDPLPP